MIQEIELSKLKVHPKNVRKTYRDIDELAESIKAKGILQNLTVVPDPGEDGTYFVVIGNRRLTAARQAGLETAPCFVTEMSEKDQAATMLLENMQRDDLTIHEQAQGFQMVLDLGETEDGLAEKTGFSKTTIRRRLNIAKLDQEELQKKEAEDSFQLSLTDLYELEKIKSVEKRNKILKNASNSRDITASVRREIADEKREANSKKLIKMLKKNSIEAAPDSVSMEIYTGKWETVKTYSLTEDVPKSVDVKPDGKEKLYYYKQWNELKVIRRAKKVKRELTPEEKKRAEKDSRKKKIKAIAKDMAVRRREFILDIISGKIKAVDDAEKLCVMLWQVMRDSNAYISNSSFLSYIAGKSSYDLQDDERAATQEKVDKLNVVEQTLISADKGIESLEFTEWNGVFRKNTGRIMKIFYEALGMYGFSYSSDDEAKLVEGTHDLYIQEEKK